MPETKKTQYARVRKDKSQYLDKEGKEFVDKVGTVLEVEGDYSCFSFVLLQFEDGKKQWFSNTMLDEVDKNGRKIE
jgi:uncharacterized protein (DUF1330 family)